MKSAAARRVGERAIGSVGGQRSPMVDAANDSVSHASASSRPFSSSLHRSVQLAHECIRVAQPTAIESQKQKTQKLKKNQATNHPFRRLPHPMSGIGSTAWMVRGVCLCIHGDGGENLNLAGFFLVWVWFWRPTSRGNSDPAPAVSHPHLRPLVLRDRATSVPTRKRTRDAGGKAGGGEVRAAGTKESGNKRAGLTDPSGDSALRCTVIVRCSLIHLQLAG